MNDKLIKSIDLHLNVYDDFYFRYGAFMRLECKTAQEILDVIKRRGSDEGRILIERWQK